MHGQQSTVFKSSHRIIEDKSDGAAGGKPIEAAEGNHTVASQDRTSTKPLSLFVLLYNVEQFFLQFLLFLHRPQQHLALRDGWLVRAANQDFVGG